MSSSRRREARIPEPIACVACGKKEVVSVVATCRLGDGLVVKRLRHYRCRSCGARLFDDAAMGRIQQQRAAATVDPLADVRTSTGIADLAEHFDGYRFGRRP